LFRMCLRQYGFSGEIFIQISLGLIILNRLYEHLFVTKTNQIDSD